MSVHRWRLSLLVPAAFAAAGLLRGTEREPLPPPASSFLQMAPLPAADSDAARHPPWHALFEVTTR